MKKNKDSYLKALKFFKHYDKLDILYDKKSVSFGLESPYNSSSFDYSNIDWSHIANKLIENDCFVYPSFLEGNVLTIKRLVYNKVVDKAVWTCGVYKIILKDDKIKFPDIIPVYSAGADEKTLKSIAKWAESKHKTK